MLSFGEKKIISYYIISYFTNTHIGKSALIRFKSGSYICRSQFDAIIYQKECRERARQIRQTRIRAQNFYKTRFPRKKLGEYMI